MDTHIEAMARRLVEAGLVRPDQTEAAAETMGGHWADKVAIVWEVADVLNRCPGLTQEEATNILLSEAAGGDAECDATAESFRDTAAEWYGDRAFAEDGGGGEDADTHGPATTNVADRAGLTSNPNLTRSTRVKNRE